MRNQQNRNDRNLLLRHRRVSRTPERCTSGSRNSTAFAHPQKAATSDPSPVLPIRSVLDEDRQTEMKNKFVWAFRTAGAAAKRGWRTLARVRQHGFFPATNRLHCRQPIKSAHASRDRYLPGPALAAHPWCSRFAAHAATNANQKFNRDRLDSSPLPFPIPAGKHAFVVETA